MSIVQGLQLASDRSRSDTGVPEAKSFVISTVTADSQHDISLLWQIFSLVVSVSPGL